MRPLGATCDRLARLPERFPARTIGAVGLVLAIAYSASLIFLPKPDGRVVVGDAVHYYVYLRSAVYDRDLNFRNDYVRLYGIRQPRGEAWWIFQPTATGHVRNLMPIGPALAWTPLFLLVSAAVAIGRLFGLDYPLDGFGRWFQASAGLSGILAATLGSWFAYRLAERLFGARAAIWATLGMWLGSSAVYYSAVSPAYSHAVSMLATGAFAYVWATSINRQTPGRYAAVGALGGAAALVRWQDAVFLLAPLIDAALHAARVRTRTFLNLAACGAAALLVFSPQMAVWDVLYGRPLLIPQGGEFMQWGSPSLLAVLFSHWHGLITWTPIVALALAGTAVACRRSPLIGIGLAVVLAAAWYANAAVADWWAGEAFGARRFVSCFPIFVVGLAAVFRRLERRPVTVAIIGSAFAIANLLLLFQYQLFMHGLREIAPYPETLYTLGFARFVVPFEFLRWWWTH